MNKVLGLDLGTNSIGWALVHCHEHLPIVVVWCRNRMNYNSDISIATDGNKLQRRLLSIKMAVFMDKVCKNHMLSTKRVVFVDGMWKCRDFGLKGSITWCKIQKKKSQILEIQRFAIQNVPGAGIEPARIAPLVFETSASTDSAIRAGWRW